MSWLARVFRRGKLYDDLAAEMREHLAEKTEQFLREGMSRDEAERAARRSFGNATLIEQRSREVWQWPTFESLWGDTKYAVRQLLKSPGITLVAIVTLALGIGANTAIFTLTWNIILKSLPVPHPGELIEYEMRKGDAQIGLSGPEYAMLRERQKSCTDLLAWASDSASVRQGSRSGQLPIQLLTGNAFQVLQMQPYLGRFFTEREADSGGTEGIPVILAYDYWRSQFQGDPRALGQSIVVADHAATVVGVMPQAFEGLTANLHPSVYLPFSFADLLYGKDFRTSPTHFNNFVLGRLRPGMKLANAISEARAIEPSLRKAADPSGIYMNGFFKGFALTVRDGSSGVSWVKMTYERPLFVLEMLVLFLLVLCGVNTALVMMARVSGRQHEYAIRAALGARHGRLIRQVLLETILLAVPGLVGGVFLGWLGAHALVTMLGSRGKPQEMDLHPNAIILAVNLATTLLIALGAGMIPAMRASKTAPALDLKATGRSVSSKSMGGWAIALQVAVSLCLVSAALLLGGTLTRLLTEDSGLVFKGAASGSIDLGPLKLPNEQNAAVLSRLHEALRSKPGVIAVGYTGMLPLSGHFMVSQMFSIDQKHIVHSDHSMYTAVVTPGYFAAVGTRILDGESVAGPPVQTSAATENSLARNTDTCALSRSEAAYFFPGPDGVNPIGEMLYRSTPGKPDGTILDAKDACRVVAVVEDSRYVSLREPAPRTMFQINRPDAQTDGSTDVVVRASSDALALAALREAVAEIVPANAVVHLQLFSQHADEDLSRERMLMSLSGSFAILALLLTALGLYGLLMRAVVLRTREIGIRIALGAQRKSILIAIGRRALIEVLAGLVAGTVVAAVLDRVVRGLLALPASSGVSGYLLSALLILLVALFAVLTPARRATSIDPMEALRAD